MTTRIYCPDIPETAASFSLEGNAAHHVVSVLRAKPGKELVLFDGQDHEFPAVIERIEKKRVFLRLLGRQHISRESPLSVHLVQGLSKGDKMDWIVQKAVELGAARITPVTTQYSAVKLDGERLHKKTEHWRAIAVSACEQCGRNRIPLIDPVCTYEQIIQKTAEENIFQERWILHPDQKNAGFTPFEKGGSPQSGRGISLSKVQINIGPEGGFSDDEAALALANGYKMVRIGPRILRTETASIAVLSVIQALYGDWR